MNSDDVVSTTMETIWLSHSVEETLALAARFAVRLRGGGAVALQGDLGSGKTCFAKGVVSALSGVEPAEIPSPTFTLVEEYRGEGPIYHVDLYRMRDAREAEELAWDEILAPGAVALVEWPERMEKIIPYCQFRLSFSKEGEGVRRIALAERATSDVCR